MKEQIRHILEKHQVGDIFVMVTNTNPSQPENPQNEFTYYRLNDDMFEVHHLSGDIDYFKGLHLCGIGSTYFYNTRGSVLGLEYILTESVKPTIFIHRDLK